MRRIEPNVNGRDGYDCAEPPPSLELVPASCANFWKIPRKFKWVEDELVYLPQFKNIPNDAQLLARTREVNLDSDLDGTDGVYVNLYAAVVNLDLSEVVFTSACYVPDPCDEPAFEMGVVDLPLPEIPPPSADPDTPWVECPGGYQFVSELSLTTGSSGLAIAGAEDVKITASESSPCEFVLEGEVQFNLGIPCSGGYTLTSEVEWGEGIMGELNLEGPQGDEEDRCEIKLTGRVEFDPSFFGLTYTKFSGMEYSTSTHQLSYTTQVCRAYMDGEEDCGAPVRHAVTTAKPCPDDESAGGAVYGTVVGSNVAGVQATLTGVGYSESTTSDADGEYRFTDLEDGAYSLTLACASGGVVSPSEWSVTVSDGSTEVVPDATSYCE